MAASLSTTSIIAQISGGISESLALETVNSSINKKETYTFTDGTGANKAKNIYSAQNTLAASTGADLDLSGDLPNAFGDTLAFTKVKAVLVKAASGNTNDVLVGGAAANGFISWVGGATDKVAVKPGGLILLAAPDATGYAVTAGTADLLRVENSGAGTAVTYDIVIMGEE